MHVSIKYIYILCNYYLKEWEEKKKTNHNIHYTVEDAKDVDISFWRELEQTHEIVAKMQNKWKKQTHTHTQSK